MSDPVEKIQCRLDELEGRSLAVESFLEQMISFLGKALPEDYFVQEIENISNKLKVQVKRGKISFDSKNSTAAFLAKIDDIETGFYYRENDLE